MPRGLFKAIQRMYTDNEALYSCDGVLRWLFKVVSGVLQGCPLSVSLFVISIDPLLVFSKRKIEDMSLGTVRACADDIGASLRALYYLPILDRAFHECRFVSRLVLKPKKCVLILTSIFASDSNVAAIRRWLKAECPRWANFQITNAGKYLGLLRGLHGGAAQLKEPLDKFKQRTREGKAATLPLRAGCLEVCHQGDHCPWLQSLTYCNPQKALDEVRKIVNFRTNIRHNKLSLAECPGPLFHTRTCDTQNKETQKGS